jgi:hypothetical protein
MKVKNIQQHAKGALNRDKNNYDRWIEMSIDAIIGR